MPGTAARCHLGVPVTLREVVNACVSDEELEGISRRMTRTLVLGGAYPRHQGRVSSGVTRDCVSADGNLVLDEEPETLKDRIRRRRLSVDGAVRVRASSSSERLHSTAMTTTRAPGFVSSPRKHLPLTQRALSFDSALRARASSCPDRLKIEEFSHSAAMAITRAGFVSSPKKHLPPSPGAGSPHINLRPNSEFDFRRTRKDLPAIPWRSGDEADAEEYATPSAERARVGLRIAAFHQ